MVPEITSKAKHLVEKLVACTHASLSESDSWDFVQSAGNSDHLSMPRNSAINQDTSKNRSRQECEPAGCGFSVP
jgi:hypothetical protein